MLKDSYDVVVVGAGPGGCAAAAICARGGLATLLLERSKEPVFKVGESLMPATYSTFEAMGALPRIRAAGFVEKHSVQFFPKGGKRSAPFYFRTLWDEERARTWQVLRADFDQLLLEVAGEQGAECHRGVNVREVLFEGHPAQGGRARGVRVGRPGDEPVDVEARVVVDASGQSSLIRRHVDLERVDYGLQHASVFTHYRGALRDSGIDEGATLILHTEDGDSWFWFIPLAGDLVSVGVVGALDYLIKGRQGSPEAILQEEASKCPEIARRIAGAERCRPVSVIKDFSYGCKQIAGAGWVLVGDAFSFIDPVYSSGVFLALKSGELAAEAILEGVGRDDLSAAQLGSFEPPLRQAMDSIYRLVQRFYTKGFSFGAFLRQYPQHQRDVTRILVGDVLEEDFDELFADMQRHHERQSLQEASTA